MSSIFWWSYSCSHFSPDPPLSTSAFARNLHFYFLHLPRSSTFTFCNFHTTVLSRPLPFLYLNISTEASATQKLSSQMLISLSASPTTHLPFSTVNIVKIQMGKLLFEAGKCPMNMNTFVFQTAAWKTVNISIFEGNVSILFL